MTYSAKSIANFFLEHAKEAGQSISPMKLQKLVYYANGWYAGYTGKPLIDETVEAWQYGPVIESIYHEFKRFGSGPITERATEMDWDSLDEQEIPAPTDESIRKFLASIWSSYGKYTAVALSEMTHAPDSPWAKTWTGVRGKDIPFDLIKSHFREAVEIAKQKRAAIEASQQNATA